jgi:hypothetical protein
MKLFLLGLLISAPLYAESNLEILERLARDEKYGKVVGVHTQPNYSTTISAEYVLPEFEIKPNEVHYFAVPKNLSINPLSQIGFSHRQKGIATSERDSRPGLTSALVYTSDIPGDELRYWAGPASGKLGAKFAEYRGSPEFDALYEWPLKGHYGVTSKTKTNELIRANVIRIQNTGVDNVYFSKLAFEVIPSKSDIEENLVFTPNSDFGEPSTMKGRNYGGGQKLQGIFPNALRLSSYDHKTQPELPTNFQINKNELTIDLPVGKKFSSIAIMCGDSHPDRVRNKDKGWGTPGDAQLSLRIVNKLSGEERILLKNKNVGPEGVITAAELIDAPSIQQGDQLVVSNRLKKSTLYIMAIKLGLNNEK